MHISPLWSCPNLTSYLLASLGCHHLFDIYYFKVNEMNFCVTVLYKYVFLLHVYNTDHFLKWEKHLLQISLASNHSFQDAFLMSENITVPTSKTMKNKCVKRGWLAQNIHLEWTFINQLRLLVNQSVNLWSKLLDSWREKSFESKSCLKWHYSWIGLKDSIYFILSWLISLIFYCLLEMSTI